MTKKKKRKRGGAGAKKTMEVDPAWLEEHPGDVPPPAEAAEAAPAAHVPRHTMEVDPAWLEDPPTAEHEASPNRIVPPALPPLAQIMRPRARVAVIPREDPVSDPPPPPRRTSRRPPSPSAAPPRSSSKRPPAPSGAPPRRASKRPPSD